MHLRDDFEENHCKYHIIRKRSEFWLTKIKKNKNQRPALFLNVYQSIFGHDTP